MGTWAATSDVTARVAYATIGASSKPTTAQVSGWIDDAEAMIKNRLRAASIAIPGASGDAASELKRYNVDYAVAQTRLAWASANGGEPGDDYAERLLADFNAFLDDVVRRPDYWSEVLEAGSAGKDSLRLHGTANSDIDGRARTASGMTPTFTRTTEI